jgi:hypothetical protein
LSRLPNRAAAARVTGFLCCGLSFSACVFPSEARCLVRSLLRQCSAPPPPDVLIRVCDLILRPSVQSPVAPRILALQASDVAVRLSFSLLSCFCCHGSSAGRVRVSAAAASIGIFPSRALALELVGIFVPKRISRSERVHHSREQHKQG